MKATIYDLRRYCQNTLCTECKLNGNNKGVDGYYCVDGMMFLEQNYKYLDYINKVVTEWCTSHPVKTRKTEFMKLFPNCILNKEGYPIACVQNYDETVECTNLTRKNNTCGDCQSKFWDKEV